MELQWTLSKIYTSRGDQTNADFYERSVEIIRYSRKNDDRGIIGMKQFVSKIPQK